MSEKDFFVDGCNEGRSHFKTMSMSQHNKP